MKVTRSYLEFINCLDRNGNIDFDACSGIYRDASLLSTYFNESVQQDAKFEILMDYTLNDLGCDDFKLPQMLPTLMPAKGDKIFQTNNGIGKGRLRRSCDTESNREFRMGNLLNSDLAGSSSNFHDDSLLPIKKQRSILSSVDNNSNYFDASTLNIICENNFALGFNKDASVAKKQRTSEKMNQADINVNEHQGCSQAGVSTTPREIKHGDEIRGPKRLPLVIARVDKNSYIFISSAADNITEERIPMNNLDEVLSHSLRFLSDTTNPLLEVKVNGRVFCIDSTDKDVRSKCEWYIKQLKDCDKLFLMAFCFKGKSKLYGSIKLMKANKLLSKETSKLNSPENVDLNNFKECFEAGDSDDSDCVIANQNPSTDSPKVIITRPNHRKRSKTPHFVCSICSETFKCKVTFSQHCMNHKMHRHNAISEVIQSDCSFISDHNYALHSKIYKTDISNVKNDTKRRKKYHLPSCSGSQNTLNHEDMSCDEDEQIQVNEREIAIQNISNALNKAISLCESMTCILCPVDESPRFSSSYDLMKHVEIHRVNNEFLCKCCRLKFRDFSTINQHLLTTSCYETTAKKYTCNFCEMVFMYYEQLQIHMLVHVQFNLFDCYKCSAGFDNIVSLGKHLSLAHRLLISPSSSSENSSSEDINDQSSSEEEDDEVEKNYKCYEYKCRVCQKFYCRKGMFQKHMAKEHPGESLPGSNGLSMIIVSETIDYSCPYCAKVYKSADTRLKHINNKHVRYVIPRIRVHKCQYCDKQYSTHKKLKVHQKTLHSKLLAGNLNSVNSENEDNESPANVHTMEVHDEPCTSQTTFVQKSSKPQPKGELIISSGFNVPRSPGEDSPATQSTATEEEEAKKPGCK